VLDSKSDRTKTRVVESLSVKSESTYKDGDLWLKKSLQASPGIRWLHVR